MKITKSTKEKIVKAVYDKKVKPLEEALRQKIKQATMDYISFMLRPHLSFMSGAPKGFLFESQRFEMRFSESYHDQFDVTLDEPMYIPYSWSNGNSWIRISISGKWKDLFIGFNKEALANKKYRDELTNELNGFLAGITTDKKILEEFPEIKEFINLSDFQFSPPVVQTAKLKRLLEEGAK